jgi:hypothetical protein
LQHPSARDPEEVEKFRQNVRRIGLQAYALRHDNRPLYKPLLQIASMLDRFPSGDPLILPYTQLCLDGVGAKLAAFFGVDDPGLVEAAVAPERPTALQWNEKWIGHI